MLLNYLKIAWRSLLKDRQFTLLNILGLSSGLICAVLIYLWVNDELQMDKFHKEEVYQVMSNIKGDRGVNTLPQTQAMLADALKDEMPEVQYAAAVIYPSWWGETTLSVKDVNLKAVGYYAEKDYFNIFSYPLLQGNKDQVLTDKHTIVISKQLAMKLFHTTDNVIGKIIELQHESQFTVSGVYDVPASSSIKHDYIIPFAVYMDQYPYLKEWGNLDPLTYVVLKKGADASQFNRKLAGFIKTKDKTSAITLFTRKYAAAYLYNKYENGVQAGGRIEYVRLFSIIAVFILLIASVNFMNLATARASRRLKEVGVRKVVGANRGLLIFQYLGESVMITFMALIITLIAVPFLLPLFNDVTGKQIALHFDPILLMTILGITLLTGLFAGAYPAFYVSGFNPVAILKGKLRASAGELWVRKGLVIFQFFVSVVFIVAVLVVYRQIRFIEKRNPGFNADNVVSFQLVSEVVRKTPPLLQSLRAIPGVVAASSMDHASIIEDFGSTSDIIWEGKGPHDNVDFANIGVNYDMIETLGMEMSQGRSFNSRISADSTEIIFNEAAIKSMGLTDPVGKTVNMWGVKRKIAGVVKNFNFESLHENIKPFAMRLEPLQTYRVMVRIKAGREHETIAALKVAFEKYEPGVPFDYKFLDSEYQAQYIAESRLATLSAYAAGFTILISCLGLFGLAAFTAQRRYKEIGIRKVLGASEGNVIFMLSGDFLKLVLIAVAIAVPFAWWAMDRWLQGFAFHIQLGPDVFLIAAVATVLVTLGTVSYQAVRAAWVNPVKSLKTE